MTPNLLAAHLSSCFKFKSTLLFTAFFLPLFFPNITIFVTIKRPKLRQRLKLRKQRKKTFIKKKNYFNLHCNELIASMLYHTNILLKSPFSPKTVFCRQIFRKVRVDVLSSDRWLLLIYMKWRILLLFCNDTFSAAIRTQRSKQTVKK